MSRHGGQLLLIGLLLILLGMNFSRVIFQTEDNPAFLSNAALKIQVELGNGFTDRSIHQFIDGSSWRDVINLTGYAVSTELDLTGRLQQPVKTGHRIDLSIKDRQINGFELTWMAAAKRIALGIPLHPDAMSTADWQMLPGVGPALALRIEKNRQEYGDFGTFSNLSRVPGLGRKRLSTWNQYFFAESIAM